MLKKKVVQWYGKVGLMDKHGKSGTVPPKLGLLIGMMVSPVIVRDTKPHILGIWGLFSYGVIHYYIHYCTWLLGQWPVQIIKGPARLHYAKKKAHSMCNKCLLICPH